MILWVAAAILIILRLIFGLRLVVERKRRRNVKTIIILGSGGHTAEMLTLLRSFDLAAYQPRCYVVASTDKLSAQKAAAFEAEHAAASGPRPSNAQPGGAPTPSYSIAVIPRSREVGQSFTSSVWTTLLALWHSMRPVAAFRPDLVLVNGPGTALPMVLATWCLRALGLSAGKVVYSESIARVRHMSLTGKILYHLRLTDEFMVQWEELREAYPRCAYAGRLM